MPGRTPADLALVRLVQEVDAAEARGDALGALTRMADHPLSEGRPFWRPQRVLCLEQLACFGPELPRWATSRWLLEQARQGLFAQLRPASIRARARAVALRGGLGALPGSSRGDAYAKVVDHDWVYRQLHLYDHGALATFLRTAASPALVEAADDVRAWARAPMRALRLLERGSRTLTWQDVATGDRLELLNHGAATVVEVDECALGRVVTVEQGAMLEGVPLAVPQSLAEDVAAAPGDWLAALERWCAGEHGPAELPIGLAGRSSLLCDVPDVVWQLVALSMQPGAGRSAGTRVTAATVVAGAAELVRAAAHGQLAAGPREVDPHGVVFAVLGRPEVVDRLACTLTPDELPDILALGERLADPAGALCRLIAAEVGRAA